MKKEKNNIASWIAFVIFLPAMPLIIKVAIYFCTNKNLFDDYVSFIGELSVFALLLSIDNIKELFVNRRSSPTLFINKYTNTSTLHIIIFSIVILILLSSLVLYVMSVEMVLSTIIRNSFDLQILKWGSAIASISSFAIGLAIQNVRI